MPDSANPVQQSLTVIEIWPFKGGWQCYEGPGVQPVLDWRTSKRGRNRLRHCASKIRSRRSRARFDFEPAHDQLRSFEEPPAGVLARRAVRVDVTLFCRYSRHSAAERCYIKNVPHTRRAFVYKNHNKGKRRWAKSSENPAENCDFRCELVRVAPHFTRESV